MHCHSCSLFHASIGCFDHNPSAARLLPAHLCPSQLCIPCIPASLTTRHPQRYHTRGFAPEVRPQPQPGPFLWLPEMWENLVLLTVILQSKGTHRERDVSRCREKKRLCKYALWSYEAQVSHYSSVGCGYSFHKVELTITTGLCSYHQL